ncbi:MAG: hypothetical protein KJP02_00390 [Octadecabacter sp.]|nr:hypothetical protein [Octadecabacter sp.]
MKNTLLLIFAFLALMIGSFIWFVATWDRDAEQPVSMAPSSSWPIQLPPEGPPAAGAPFSENIVSGSDPYRTHTGPIPNPYGIL